MLSTCRGAAALTFMIRFLALLAPLALCFGQTATVNGIVSDTSDAVIVRAQLEIENLDTGLRREAQTNEAGAFSFNLLPVGRYRLTATQTGFGISERPEIKLDIDQVARIDFKLKPGAVSESVQVTAAAALLDSETSTVGQVISNKNIVELPLNGRNYLNLASLTAGTAPSIGGRTAAEGGFVAGGQHGYQVNIVVDGLDNNSVASGGPLGFEAQGVKPSIDAVGEFRVVTNNLSAEYGGRMGGTVLVNLKSGTNQAHGTEFEFVRNDKLDGTNFFANRNGVHKPVYRQNQFGGTLGGPIQRNRTFLFGSFEGTRIRTGTASTSTVPTIEERAGDFSKIRPVYDPQSTTGTGGAMTRRPFPGFIIPRDMWDPLFPKLLALYPLPLNDKIVNNYFFSATDRNSTNTYDFKGDHNITDRARLSIRYSRRDKDQFQNGPLPLPADGGLATTTWITSHSVVSSFTQNLNAQTNNEVRFGFSRISSAFDIPYDKPLFDDFGIKGIPKTNVAISNDHGLSRFTPAGYAELGSRSFWPNTNNMDLLQVNDVLFRSAGAHSIKAGFEFKHQNIYRNAARFARGQFAFNREFTADPQNRGNTGDGLAEFMLGWAAAGTLGNENGENAMVRTVGAFVQDDWKVSPRLTLNLGLRYDVFFVPTFPDGGVSNFALDYAGAGSNAQLRQVRPSGSGDCGCEQNLRNFGPRVGLAYRLGNNTVLRSGVGIIYAQGDYLTDQVARFKNQSPDFIEIGFATLDRITPRLVLKDGFPPVQLPATSVPGPASVGINAQQGKMADQYSEQWFFDIQRELPLDVLATVGYQGNGTHHMLIAMDYDLPFGPAASTVASRRIFPYYTAVTRLVPMGNLTYNALIWKMEKRFARGFALLSAFTWAHAIDNLLEPLNTTADQGPVAPYNRRLNRGNSNADIRRTYAFSSTYELPFGHGKSMLNRGGAWNVFFGGWQLSGILTLRSGIPFTVTTSGGITNAGGADRPNRIADGTLSSSQRSIDRWFDLTAFQVQQQYTYGNSGRNILFGPGLRNIDFSIGKSFPIGEVRRLQFRAESFNLTNTPAFNQPSHNINSLGAGAITGADDPRRLQFGLKFIM
jgi:Carboxypeptidase regulatory-like domain/TonB dependent receptor-like, beta-barrel